jgi:hypothetical protein
MRAQRDRRVASKRKSEARSDSTIGELKAWIADGKTLQVARRMAGMTTKDLKVVFAEHPELKVCITELAESYQEKIERCADVNMDGHLMFKLLDRLDRVRGEQEEEKTQVNVQVNTFLEQFQKGAREEMELSDASES